MGIFILAAIAVLLLIYYLWQRSSSGLGKEQALRQQIHRLLQQPPDSANETIERYMANLKERYPGHPEEWYLEKIIYDLERDR